MFKKTCFLCGAKEDILYKGECSKCFKETNPPIVELKPINLQYCNTCKKIHYNNQLLTQEELEKRLPQIVEKNLIIEKNYTLKELNITNFEIVGEKVSFDIETDFDLKTQSD
jgi:NMD protein affecting ribosome stability and mRNA decay